MQTVTLTQQEQDQIKELRTSFGNLITDLGLVSYQMLDLTDKKNQIESQILEIRNTEAAMYQQLSGKYGTGYVDEAGNFIKT